MANFQGSGLCSTLAEPAGSCSFFEAVDERVDEVNVPCMGIRLPGEGDGSLPGALKSSQNGHSPDDSTCC